MADNPFSEEILPCPFCGEAAEVYRINGEFNVACKSAGCYFGNTTRSAPFGYTYAKDAVDLWNRRTPIQSLIVKPEKDNG